MRKRENIFGKNSGASETPGATFSSMDELDGVYCTGVSDQLCTRDSECVKCLQCSAHCVCPTVMARPLDHTDACEKCGQLMKVYTKRAFVLCASCTAEKFST